jgi:diguanylate cyclase (GGDEF)-like protein
MPTPADCLLPDNEPQRLRAVRSYEILDTEPELEFDALTRVASHTFSAPIAVVAMMDADRLWFKSKLGLDIPQLDRKIAFCAHAIMRPREAMVIPDLLSDQRFAENPLVADAPHLRFYAGAPIVDPTGLALGTIAVIDTQPRSFSDAQRDALMDLSTLVVTALQARRRAIDLQRMAMTDYLTGVGNRVQFEKALAAELNHSKRAGTPFSVVCMDLDGFKSVNDTLGHAAGDEVLCEVSRRLSALVRQGDVLARLGGDEFAIVMRCADQASASALADRIAKTVRQPITLSRGQTVGIGVSVGYATHTDGVPSAAALLARADRALYEAKRQSGDRTAAPSPTS